VPFQELALKARASEPEIRPSPINATVRD